MSAVAGQAVAQNKALHRSRYDCFNAWDIPSDGVDGDGLGEFVSDTVRLYMAPRSMACNQIGTDLPSMRAFSRTVA
jgi:hypothetical protein